jgi:antitoxin (DNA-binding transcriptional repressor) of toxin-antitoxin stability system
MHTVSLEEAKRLLSELATEAASGAEVTIARNGVRVAKLVVTPRKVLPRIPGELRDGFGWENFEYNDSLFAPMTEEEMKSEGWSTY